jgi:hypothetical protein
MHHRGTPRDSWRIQYSRAICPSRDSDHEALSVALRHITTKRGPTTLRPAVLQEATVVILRESSGTLGRDFSIDGRRRCARTAVFAGAPRQCDQRATTRCRCHLTRTFHSPTEYCHTEDLICLDLNSYDMYKLAYFMIGTRPSEHHSPEVGSLLFPKRGSGRSTKRNS